ncbi:MAG: helix-turn-helix domain-containing protein [Rickettsiales bacterium]|jgi:hypothetical protein|nr:helix-turn-helix domain-containing protein [Rickettsiales bacterium]
MFWDGIRFWSRDENWCGIMTDLGAVPVPKATADVVIDSFGKPLSIAELKSRIIAAKNTRDRETMRAVFGRDENLAPAQQKIVTMLHNADGTGVSAEELRAAFGYSSDTNTHTIETAVSALRRKFGPGFIVFENGKYKIGQVQVVRIMV